MEIAGLVFLAAMASVALVQAAVVVPEQNVYLLERLGRFRRSLRPGLHWVIPFLETVAYRLSLKEAPLEIPQQPCMTRDNVRVAVDAVVCVRVVEPKLACYGVEDHRVALLQAAQSSIRGAIAQVDPDQAIADRLSIGLRIAAELDKAAAAWGVEILRCEIRSLTPPDGILEAVERQMRAQHEKRALALQSEASREAEVNEAQGHALAISTIARATAEGVREVGRALSEQDGDAALLLRVAEQYAQQLGEARRTSDPLVVREDLTDIASRIELATGLGEESRESNSRESNSRESNRRE